jgi:hypothetical protein
MGVPKTGRMDVLIGNLIDLGTLGALVLGVLGIRRVHTRNGEVSEKIDKLRRELPCAAMGERVAVLETLTSRRE